MKTTVKKINTQLAPAIGALGEKAQAAIQQLTAQINAQNQTNGVAEVQAKIRECEEELRMIELTRTIKKLRSGVENAEINLQPVDVEFDVPDSLKGVLRDVRPTKKKPGK